MRRTTPYHHQTAINECTGSKQGSAGVRQGFSRDRRPLLGPYDHAQFFGKDAKYLTKSNYDTYNQGNAKRDLQNPKNFMP